MNATEPADASVRAFVALKLGPEVREALAAAERRLQRAPARVGWVRPENIHLTLAFLGDITLSGVGAIAGTLDSIGRHTAPFSFAVEGIGSFGGRRPRVVWAGIPAPSAGPVIALQKPVADALQLLGYRLEDRAFQPHLTLGRVRSSAGAEARVRALAELRDARFGQVEAGSVFLMRSQLLSAGPAYSILHEAPLAGNAR